MIRTCDLLVRSQTLYPTELRARNSCQYNADAFSRLCRRLQSGSPVRRWHSYSGGMTSTITGIEPEQSPALAAIEQRIGHSNFFRMLAHRPEAMQEVDRLYNVVMGPGSLDLRLKEMVYIAVSAVNESEYCFSSHSASGTKTGLSSADIDDLRAETNQNFNEREQAALHYAREMTRNASTEGETRTQLERLFSSQQLVELTLTVALANFTNRISNGLAIQREKAESKNTVTMKG